MTDAAVVTQPQTQMAKKKSGRRRMRKSAAKLFNTKLYIEGQRIVNFDKNMTDSEYQEQTHTFMSRWTIFFIYFNVFYLILVLLALTVTTLVLFFADISENSDEIYKEYVLD